MFNAFFSQHAKCDDLPVGTNQGVLQETNQIRPIRNPSNEKVPSWSQNAWGGREDVLCLGRGVFMNKYEQTTIPFAHKPRHNKSIISYLYIFFTVNIQDIFHTCLYMFPCGLSTAASWKKCLNGISPAFDVSSGLCHETSPPNSRASKSFQNGGSCRHWASG